MARKRTSIFEDFIDVIARLPWWVGVALALVSYIWLHQIASMPALTLPTDVKQMGTFMSSQIWGTFASLLQYALPIACLLGAGVSAYKTYVKGTAASFRTRFKVPQESKVRSVVVSSGPLLPCPICGEQMVKRVAKKGQHAGEEFWGCSKFPQCRGTRK